ncbi:receptor-like protein 46 [Quercus suber]|uniref:receptor-like protein 46 n=1 Tax=Quercus suber TaxID=58331 RepID=UPI000CE288C1|nr:LRR receptor-like serine/threonine-protein kinase FLS2 [Quercus suber]POE98120.1 putative inactive leucine-rich repeat receptor kinase xiao [Quercus suber]
MAKLTLLLLLELLIFFTPSLSCPEYQKQALLNFKASLINSTSTTTTTTSSSEAQRVLLFESWNSSSDCCDWERVNCSSSLGSRTVTALYLHNLVDQLPWEHTVLTSNILTPLFHIRSLTHLEMSKNKIQGELPSDGFANLTELIYLDLGWNDFFGSIPSQLFQLRYLKYLDMGSNNFHDIPKEIGNMTESRHLEFLDLSENQLEGMFPQWLAEMEVVSIILSGNNLTGSLPPFLFNSINLNILSLSRNNFYGELPSNIGNATYLLNLMLNDNNFSGKIPDSISNLHFMILDLSNNKFSGNSLPDFSSNMLPQIIDLSSNDLSGEISTNFSILTRVLSLGKNKFSGIMSTNLNNMRILECLDIHDNKITGEIPDFICQISTLRILNLRNNSFQGTIHDCISNLTSLQILDLSSNHLVGKIPTKFGNFTGMIETSNESIGVVIPVMTTSFSFQGKINDLILNWKKSAQGLSWKNLMITSFLDLSMNQLSGEIPTTLGSLKALKVFNVSHNNLYGRIPASLGDLFNLESLDLSHNNLSSSIPKSLAKLQQLTILDVSNNKLAGRIPRGSQMDTMNDPKFYANNNGLCGMQIRVLCPEDFPLPKPPKVEVESKERWFSWEGVGIGYAVSFIITVGVLYLAKYFVPAKPSNYRGQQRRRRI